MALPQAKLDTTEARLARLDMPEGASWANSARQDALSRLRTMGLPGPRDEYWRFTRPDDLNAPFAPGAAVFDPNET
ncbi:MAG: Fe-S cluster assembly protein SufD, partial [Boseongicola sp.]|nr:Fe-S cluster assembly protein SufD [Boseongicola sp.]